MLISYNKIMQLILPVAFLLGSFFIGLIFEKLVIIKLKKIAAATKWEGDDIIVKACKGMVLLLFIVGGVYGAVLTAPINRTILDLVQKILLVTTIVLVTIISAKTAEGFIKFYSSKSQGVLPTTSIFVNITRIVVFIVGALIGLQSLGISITPILTALGVGGLAVALALQDTLNNLFSGLNIIASKQIKIGEYVKIDSGQEGYIEDITWRNTIIRGVANHIIVIPNHKLASAVIINYNGPEKEVSVLVPVGVSYDSNLEEVERITVEVAKEVMNDVQGGIPEFQPVVRYNTFADSSINFNVIMRASEFGNQYIIRHEFIKRLHERYTKEGIEIPFPITTVHMKEQENK